MTEEEFYSGVSRPRNSVLMRIFLNLGIVEHTGHGIPMIVEKYGKEAFDIHQTYIDVTLLISPFWHQCHSVAPIMAPMVGIFGYRRIYLTLKIW
jgi:hypothetical protein